MPYVMDAACTPGQSRAVEHVTALLLGWMLPPSRGDEEMLTHSIKRHLDVRFSHRALVGT